MALMLMVGAVVALPLALDHLGLAQDSKTIVSLARWPVMFAILLVALGVLYRFGPSRRAARWEWLSVGTLAAALLWIAGSSLLSWYLSNFGNYDATYGSLGAAIGLMMWMWMSAIIVLCGAELNSEIEHQTARDIDGRAAEAARRPRRRDGGHGGTGGSGLIAKNTSSSESTLMLSSRRLGSARYDRWLRLSRFPGRGQSGPEGVARDMIRISTIFIAICMVLVAASLGLILYSVPGISGSESAIVALTALTFLILYNAVSMRLRDRTDVGGQIADLSRGTADLARQVAEFGRRLAAVEGRVVSANSAGADRIQTVVGEINELGVLVKQLAISVASHDDMLAAGAAAAPPQPASPPAREAAERTA